MSALTYTSHGDYLLPDIALNEPPPELTEPLTKYGFMRKSYLKTHRSIFYNQLLLSEKLYPHLRETQQVANERMDTLITQLAKRDPPPDKASDNLAWAAHMNTLKQSAEGIVLDELIYE